MSIENVKKEIAGTFMGLTLARRHVIEQWVLAALFVLCLYPSIRFSMELHEKVQWSIKRNTVLNEVWAAIDVSRKQIDLQLTASQTGDLALLYETPMSTQIGQERWERLVSKGDEIALPTCEPIRMDMTHAQLVDWAWSADTKCQFSYPE